MKNLDHLGRLAKKKRVKVEIKIVPIKGVNDSVKNISDLLEFCNKRNFYLKFLNFEPIIANHLKYKLELSKIISKIKKLSGVPMPKPELFRGQNDYLPMNWFCYKKIKAVVIEIGCGEKDVCAACHKSNEIFVTPTMEIKQCHASSMTFPIGEAIKNKKPQEICRTIVKSREFLKKTPGADASYWSINNK
jgi:molybdenum cofactor biosynthesis enzyme MoaA